MGAPHRGDRDRHRRRAREGAIAREVGCHHVLDTNTDDIAKRVREITGGVGCDVVYDGVGKATFMPSLDALRKFGMMVSFGNASGPVEAFNVGILSGKARSM